MFSEMSFLASDSRNGSEPPRSKQRRIQGACDVCKKRKIRCDSAQMPGNRCTHCITTGVDCTHADVMKTLSSARGYVAALEARVEKLERLLNKLLPGIDFTEQLENDSALEPLFQPVEEELPRNDMNPLENALKKLTLNPDTNRFFGKSSGVQLVQTALTFQSHLTGAVQLSTKPKVPHKRQEFWEMVPWLIPADNDDPQYTFPDPDLLPALVDLYFKEVNCYWPVLHRPTFDRKVADKLHLHDHRFAATLLMVCSLGARHSDDPRVILEGEDDFESAGYKWYRQVRVIPEHLIYKPDLYELQTITLSAIYLRVLPLTAVSWNQVGFGLRRAQDVGAHRRRIEPHPTAENEQWKRVFWVLQCLEWQTSTSTGRPVAMHDQDFDQDLPLDCDDECWDLPQPLNFRQPEGKPSVISFFICRIKLLEIEAAITTTIYSPRKAKDICGRPLPTDAQIIVAFDSALNSWLSDVPEHLRWDPDCKNDLHFKQSAQLYSDFYAVQILLHRPYIPVPLEGSRPGALPSLAICTNAARSCARIFNTLDKRGMILQPSMLRVACSAAIVLLLNTWSGKRSGFAYNPSKELEHVYTCLKLTTAAEKRYRVAGRYNDILSRLIEAGENLDSIFDFNSAPVAPPSAQRGYDAYTASLEHDRADPEWSAFTRHSVQEMGPDALRTDGSANSEYSKNGVATSVFPFVDDPVYPDAYRQPNVGYDFEQVMNMGSQPFSVDSMAVDTDIMSMWSTAPSGFHVDDWSSILPPEISRPQFDQFPPVPNQMYSQNTGASQRLCQDFW
ncbi:fungal-specific transcription factor domain-containing protein [Mycena epipterygia]|nr:fungal-specific transcription factor domain-containing protein [Mycena epipterygia]